MQNSNYQFLKDKWTNKHKELQKSIITKHKDSIDWLSQNSKQLAVGTLSSLVLLTTPLAKTQPSGIKVSSEQAQKIDRSIFLVSDLSKSLPNEMRPLTTEEEAQIGNTLSRSFGMKVSADLNGDRLNRSYGLIGQEQHLARFPGDNMFSHFDPPAGGQKDVEQYAKEGMAPGLGAWGYFATSAAQMTPEDNMREKYYIAVQTFLAPNFSQRVAEYRDFFRFRKMLVVNPENGKAVVAAIGDAGPAEWTGKHLGGSPEAMIYLERVDGLQRGPVLYFFIDDPNDSVPLGPIKPVQ